MYRFQVDITPMATSDSEPIRTCPHCGHTGEDVSYHTVYVGGKGYVAVLECDDRTECWQRWDAQNGLNKNGAELITSGSAPKGEGI